MGRKRLTQIFPWLLPLRQKQRTMCYYAAMAMDKNNYAKQLEKKPLKYCIYETESPLYNTETGFDMIYQHNKVHNLKVASKKMNGLLIKPGETFSFWQCVRNADKETPYKDGLVVINDQLTTVKGGGLCGLSNQLFWMFLHTPLTIVERHTHQVKDFPNPKGGIPDGVDATVAQGWLDLKVRNDTDSVFQISFSFTEDVMIGKVYCDDLLPYVITIKSENERYIKKKEKIYEKVDVFKQFRTDDGRIMEEKLCYENCCEVGYKLDDGVQVWEE